MSTREKLKKLKLSEKPTEPLWKGPLVDGVTQSMLSRYVVCKERFRIHYVEGLQSLDQFNKSIEYGQLWHACEEALLAGKDYYQALMNYRRSLMGRYPEAIDQINHWTDVCNVQFPIYVDYWEKNWVEKSRPLFQEKTFNLSYPIERQEENCEVRIRGKWDAVHAIDDGCKIELQENKTKGDIVEHQIKAQLQFDLQTMFYMVALQTLLDDLSADQDAPEEFCNPDFNIGKLRYNVVRRPLSGGKGSIRQGKTESAGAFYRRLGDVLAEEPSYWFMRWEAEITPGDMERFMVDFLDPVLANLVDDYEWWDYAYRNNASPFSNYIREKQFPYHRSRHFRLPYGVYNVLAEGGSTDLDDYLATGNKVGLHRAERLFTELEDEPEKAD